MKSAGMNCCVIRFFGWLVCFLIVAGCDSQSEPLRAQHFGWRDGRRLTKLTAEAVDQVNRLSGDTWKLNYVDSSGSRPDTTGMPNTVPVLLVNGRSLKMDEVAFVSSDHSLIVVHEFGLEQMFRADNADSEPDSSSLAFILLHELGHISNGDAGVCEVFSVGSAEPNRTSTMQKERELQADLFAAEQIRIGLSQTSDLDRNMAAMMVDSGVSLLSTQATAAGTMARFGDLSRQGFWDLGYSHPNFEYRMKIVRNYIGSAGTSEELANQARQELEEFEQSRAGEGFRFPLWSKDDDANRSGLIYSKDKGSFGNPRNSEDASRETKIE
ncbi:hypothetical protein Poly51_62340 [Rubripirellula tenax]|uniref:Peptidase family M48 n=1 Tax=Rubripirellula tenax TaxID=2528015 RepID=A0A5C6E4Q4_9BACT|nr:hypothetical protein [Rubripirellula tenax]TWU43655.1 hypothetical protein Poly51_62340 [Rubripirellula tenax]